MIAMRWAALAVVLMGCETSSQRYVNDWIYYSCTPEEEAARERAFRLCEQGFFAGHCWKVSTVQQCHRKDEGQATGAGGEP